MPSFENTALMETDSKILEEHMPALRREYEKGTWILFKNGVVKDYGTRDEMMDKAIETYGIDGHFIVRKIE